MVRNLLILSLGVGGAGTFPVIRGRECACVRDPHQPLSEKDKYKNKGGGTNAASL